MDLDRYIALYSAPLTRLCVSLTRSKEDAEDLFQETWVKAMKNFSRYDENKPFDKWLFTICVNTFKDSARLFWNKKRFLFASVEEQEAFLNSIPDRVRSTEYIELYDAVERLPKKQRVVLAVYYFRDKSLKETAQILDLSEETVKYRLKTAKNTLRRRLSDE